jgi:hypothetical protein
MQSPPSRTEILALVREADFGSLAMISIVGVLLLDAGCRNNLHPSAVFSVNRLNH